MERIRILICDDSAVMRAVLSSIFNQQPDLEVVGVAEHPLEARELIKRCNPDVLTLDIEMPHMNGLEFLEKLMRLRPMPVVMVSNFTERDSDATLHALELGAVDFMPKPRPETIRAIGCYAEELCEKVRSAHQARPSQQGWPHAAALAGADKGRARTNGGTMLAGLATRLDRVIAIGASTGGTEALREVLQPLPPDCPPIVIVQHMPEMFTTSFAKRLDSLCHVHVKEAEDGERLQPGVAYLAPGHSHLSLSRQGGGYACALSRAEPVNRHRPAVDVLFHSVAEVVGARALGVLLTGMGKDGAQGLLAMRGAGAWTIAQDEASCVVYGMPREAARLGAACEVVPLKDIPAHLRNRLNAATGPDAQ